MSHTTPDIRLRRTEPGDLAGLFVIQSDPEANAMAGTKPRSRAEFFARWDDIFKDSRINGLVIELRDEASDGHMLVGSIACFQAADEGGRDCVGYWIARRYWGRGIASRALELFLHEECRRPLYATAASSNAASRHILEKNGFRLTGLRVCEETERYIGREVAEFVLE